jgi:hypothetical protein
MQIELDNIGQYREGNRIEAKKAMGGLPNSLWDSYSAFANTNAALSSSAWMRQMTRACWL